MGSDGDGFGSRGPLGWTLPGTVGTNPGGSLYRIFPHPILMSYLCSGPQPHYEWNGFPWTDHFNMRGKKLRPEQWVSGHDKGMLRFHIPNWILGCSIWVSQRPLNLSVSRIDPSLPLLPPSSEKGLPQSSKVICPSREEGSKDSKVIL